MLAFPLVEAAGALLREMATFDSAGVAHKEPAVNEDFPPYPSGLRLQGRRVLVVGGGHVAQRRIPRLLAAGADVVVVSPDTTPAVEGLAGSGEITWHERGFEPRDSTTRGTSSPPPTTRRSTSRSAATPSSSGSSACAPTTRREATRLDPGRRPARRRHRRGARQPGAAPVRRRPRRDRGRRCATA